MTSQERIATIDPNFPYTVEEVAGILKVHPETIREWYRQGKLSYSKIGYRTIKITGQDVIEFVSKHRQEANYVKPVR